MQDIPVRNLGLTFWFGMMNENSLPPIHMAKVYLAQAKATKWRHWKMWLLDAAAKHRRLHLLDIRAKQKNIDKNGQLGLF